jgi:hypothetical protein
MLSNDNFNAPMLPISFRMLCIIGKYLGSTIEIIRIANSIKQVVHYFDSNVKCTQSYKQINNPCFSIRCDQCRPS